MTSIISNCIDSLECDQNSQDVIIKQIPLNIVSGMITGVGIAGIFHPWDKALFLSMTNKRPFVYDGQKNRFVAENFTQPDHGFMQTIAARTLANSLYFVAQCQMYESLYPYLRHNVGLYEWQAQLGVGLSIGSMTGIGANGLYAVRFQTWKNPGSSFISSARSMWLHGGVKPFMRGLSATVSRDSTFSTVYEILRNCGNNENKRDKSWQFAHDAGSAAVATLFSGPLNYARSVQFSTPPSTPSPRTGKILTDVWHESKSCESLTLRLGFFIQRFQIGWGTARVAVGMATGQKIFEIAHSSLSDSCLGKPAK